MTDDFERALSITFGLEGGQSNHAADRGGKTNLGITQSAYTGFCKRLKRPVKDVNRLTLEEAKEFYRADYWVGPGIWRLPWPFNFLAFDGGVNSGPERGKKWVQQGLGVKPDGKIGRFTIGAAQAAVAAGDGSVLFRAVEARARFLANLCQKNHSQIAFVEGWWVRTLTVLAAALAGE